MIIVCNEKLVGINGRFMTYPDFVNQAYSDKGLDTDDGLAIDVNCIEENVFNDLGGVDSSSSFTYFTLNGNVPSFMQGANVIDWSSYKIPSGNPVGQSNNNNINNNNYQQNQDYGLASNNPAYAMNSSANSGNEYGIDEDINNLIDEAIMDNDYASDGSENAKNARMIVFGSSKGGTGKTFTAIMSTYMYAKSHPDERIALVDFDIIDGQVGISIHKVRPTMARFYTEYQKGYTDFKTMNAFCVKGNSCFPKNVDFYLAPTSGSAINNNDFWLTVLQNCMQNYDVVVFDTGIDYLNIIPISYAYKIADKVNIVTTTSIKSVNSVTKQIGRLKGEIKSPGKDEDGNFTEWVFTAEDDLASKINVIITQMVPGDKMNKTIYANLSNKANVIATFGVITDSVSSAEFYGEWNVFDNNPQIQQAFKTIMS